LHRQLSLPEDLGNEAVEHRHFTLQDFESFGMNQPLANHRQRFEQEREVKPDFAFHPALDLTSRSLAKAKHSLVHHKLADLSSGRNVAEGKLSLPLVVRGALDERKPFGRYRLGADGGDHRLWPVANLAAQHVALLFFFQELDLEQGAVVLQQVIQVALVKKG